MRKNHFNSLLDNLWVQLFFIFCCLFLVFDLIDNEEVQLTFAKAFIDANWLPGNTAFSDFAGTRLFVRIYAGSFLQIFDWVTAGVVLRLINFLVFAIVISQLFKKLNFVFIQIASLIILYCLSPQSLIGDEWIFGGFEAKTIAYCAIFLSIYFYLDDRHYYTLFFCVIATYFHLLVGVWFYASLLLYLVLFEKKFKKAIWLGLIFSFTLAPLLIYVIFGNSNADIPVDFKLAEYYVYTRVPHHIGIFSNYSFISLKSISILLCIGNLILNLKLTFINPMLEKLRKLNIVIQTLILVFVLIAALDYLLFNKSLSALLATYPFRQSALSLFITFILISVKINWTPRIKTGAVAVLSVLVIATLSYNVYLSLNPKGKSDFEFNSVVEYVEENSTISDSFFLLVERQMEPHKSFSRYANRENYFIFKFTPHGTHQFYEWARRNDMYYKLNNGLMSIDEAVQEHTFDFLIADRSLESSKLDILETYGEYRIYKVIN